MNMLGIMSIESTSRMNYLQIPLNLRANLEVGNLRLYAGVGLYGSVGLWGNGKTKMSVMGVTEEESVKIKFFGDEDKLKDDEILRSSFDVGAHVFAGIGFGRFGFSVGFQPGFVSVEKTEQELFDGSTGVPKMNNSSIYFGITYMLTSPDNNQRR